MRYDGIGLRMAVVFGCLVTLAASAAPATIKLKDVKLRGTQGTEGILDWVVTSTKAGIVVACDDEGDKECAPGLALLKPNGKSKPFKSLGHDNASAALAWPGGGTSSRRPKPKGVVVVASRVEEQVFLYSGVVLNKGRVKGGLKEQAVVEAGDTVGVSIRLKAAMYGDRVGVVVAFSQREGVAVPNDAVLFFLLNSKGTLREGPVALTYPGDASTRENHYLDVVGDEDGWHILAGNALRSFDSAGQNQGRLLAWTVPVGTARAEFAARTIAELKVPKKARGVRYRATFVRDLEPLTVFYSENVLWETDEARRRKVGTRDPTRYLTPFSADSRAKPTEVKVETWARVAQYWNKGPLSIAALNDNSSAVIARGNDHVFAIARTLHRNVQGQASWLEPAQEYSIYRLNLDTGETELLSRLERGVERTGALWPILIRQFGKKTAVIFNFSDTFSHFDQPMVTSF